MAEDENLFKIAAYVPKVYETYLRHSNKSWLLQDSSHIFHIFKLKTNFYIKFEHKHKHSTFSLQDPVVVDGKYKYQKELEYDNLKLKC